MIGSTARDYRKAALQGLDLPPPMSVSEWADEYRYLTSKDSNEIGQFRTDRMPWQREIQDSLGPEHECEEVVCCKAAQMGVSTLGINWIGHTVTEDPAAMMVVQPDIPRAKLFSVQRLEDLFSQEVTPHVASRCQAGEAKHAELMKTYIGGVMQLIGANSAAGFRQMPYKKLYADEVDAWPKSLGKDGSPVGLARRGMITFEGTRKSFWLSTPLLEGESAIWDLFQAGDRRYWWVPCPKCQTFQVLKFEQLRPVLRGTEIIAGVYECESCKFEMNEHHKVDMHRQGKWVPERPEITRVRSYHVSALMASSGLGKSWGQILRDHEVGKGDPEQMQVFYNHDLGLPFPVGTEVPKWEDLYRRRENYPLGVVPEGGVVLTAGIDHQKDRAEMEVVAWGKDLESWSVNYYVFPGDIEGPDQFVGINKVLKQTFPHANGGYPLMISRCAEDTGHFTQRIYREIRRMRPDQVMAIKGAEGDVNMVRPPRTVDVKQGGQRMAGLLLWMVGTWTAKAELYGRLNLDPPLEGEEYPPGFCHFPEAYDQKHFQQLCGEQMIRVVSAGRTTHKWVEIPGVRNEQLDCRVYARAAAYEMQLDLWDHTRWDHERFQLEHQDEQRDELDQRRRPRERRR